jgi:hypothetical protein
MHAVSSDDVCLGLVLAGHGVVASVDVSLWLAESGVVGTWFGTGSPDLPHEEGLILAIRIKEDFMALREELR